MSSSHLQHEAALQREVTAGNVGRRAPRAEQRRPAAPPLGSVVSRCARSSRCRWDAAEEQQHGGSGETHGSGLALLHDRPPRSRRGADCRGVAVRAGCFHHLPDREGEAEEGRGRRRWRRPRSGERGADEPCGTRAEPRGRVQLCGLNR